MDNTKPIKVLTLFITVFLSSGCNAKKIDNKPYFNENNQSDAFFDEPQALSSADNFIAMNEKIWDYPTELGHKSLGAKEVSSCAQLQIHLKEGFKAISDADYAFVNAQSTICSMWQQIGKFKPYSQSFMKEVKLNKEFASMVPASFSLQISNKQIAKAKSAASWNEASKIKKVETKSSHNATFYDDTGSIQRLTLMAKGDYNTDGIEDQLFFVENSVEGGSYSSTKAFIITRLTANGSLSLIKEI